MLFKVEYPLDVAPSSLESINGISLAGLGMRI
jgi:hypothetical protein